MFERFDTPRPIGSGLILQPTGLAVLHELGLANAIIAQGSRIDRLFGKAGDRIVLDVRYAALKGTAFGVGIHRASLFSTLHEAVKSADIPVETSRTLIGSTLHGSKRVLTFADGQHSPPFDLIVDALGTRTPLAPPTGRALAYGALWASLDWPDQSGFNPHALEQRYRAASKMAGVLPIGTPEGATGPQAAFFWSIGADQVDAWRREGLETWKTEVAALWPATQPFLAQIEKADDLTFASYAHRTLAAPAEQAMIHIGDAWHSASPQLGQGANMALLDAYALMLGLRDHNDVDRAIAHTIRLRRWHIRLYQALTGTFTPVYQSDSRLLPLLRDRFVGPLSTVWPATKIQAALVSGLVGNPLKRLGLTS